MIDYGLKDRVALITGANNPWGIGATTPIGSESPFNTYFKHRKLTPDAFSIKNCPNLSKTD